MKLLTLIAGLLLLSAIGFAACGDDGGAPTSTPTATPGEPSDEFIEAAEDAAGDSVLTIDDFPPGWTATPTEDGEEDEALALGPECEALVGDLEESPGGVASANSDEFTGPNDEEVSSGAAVFVSEDAAQDAVDAINEAVDGCREDFEDALLEVFRATLEEDPSIDDETLESIEVSVSFQDLSIADLGDSTSAYRLNITVEAGSEMIEPVGDIVLLRVGRMAGGLFYFTIEESDIDEETALARTIVSRMQAANRVLPSR